MAEKSSFVLYTRYREQINMLNDEQAGQLMKAIFDYQAMGEAAIEDPVVAMLWSVMKQQLDIDNEKYQETCAKRKEAGAKGGKSKNSKSENKEAKQANATFAKQTKAKQADNDNEYENEIDNENDSDMSSSSDDYEDIDHSARGRCRREDAEAIVPFGKDMIPSTQEEIRKVEDLAERLCMEYKQKPPNKTDVQKVFDHVHVRTELPNGEAVATFDQQKAALLEYAWEQAAAAEKVSWRYIDGIYRNWNDNGIDSMQKLEEHEFKRQHGMSQEAFMKKIMARE